MLLGPVDISPDSEVNLLQLSLAIGSVNFQDIPENSGVDKPACCGQPFRLAQKAEGAILFVGRAGDQTRHPKRQQEREDGRH